MTSARVAQCVNWPCCGILDSLVTGHARRRLFSKELQPVSDHSMAFVPIPTWEYQSPELHKRGIQIDIGLLAEALVYYDKLLVYPGNRHEFASFVRWFAQRGLINELIALLRDGT